QADQNQPAHNQAPQLEIREIRCSRCRIFCESKGCRQKNHYCDLRLAALADYNFKRPFVRSLSSPTSFMTFGTGVDTGQFLLHWGNFTL
ncbi:MAG: hypothetical protein PHN98_01500, partial [Smithellaceae bacterium]|nr:hypothetical protein [Smithellaceae bacterium]